MRIIVCHRDSLDQGAVYQWPGEYAPAVPDLENMLFGSDFKLHEGHQRTAIDDIEVAVEGPAKIAPIKNFADTCTGLHPVVLQNIELAQYKQPTPIQAYAISAVQSGHDVVSIAQTGSGKTAAYLTPIISKLMDKAKKL